MSMTKNAAIDRMNRQHTPGPFKIMQTSDGTLDVCVEREGIRSVIARIHEEHLADEHGGCIAGNARLFCAAPELLAALRLVESITMEGANDQPTPGANDGARLVIIRNRVVAAIAQAEGRA